MRLLFRYIVGGRCYIKLVRQAYWDGVLAPHLDFVVGRLSLT
jgi:hypothetical protein